MNTDDLIKTLAADAGPVRRLPPPMIRAAVWLAISGIYVAAVVVAYRLFGTPVALVGDWRFVVEQLATTLTAVAAAIAAFYCVVPGRSRLIVLLPILPLSLWLLSVGETCIKTWNLLMSGGLEADGGWDCLPPSAIIGLGPAIFIVAMLRQGAPLRPRSTIALAALASAALGNLGLRLFHEGDVTVEMLVWQLGAIAALVSAASVIAPRLLAWRMIRPGPASAA